MPLGKSSLEDDIPSSLHLLGKMNVIRLINYQINGGCKNFGLLSGFFGQGISKVFQILVY